MAHVTGGGWVKKVVKKAAPIKMARARKAVKKTVKKAAKMKAVKKTEKRAAPKKGGIGGGL